MEHKPYGHATRAVSAQSLPTAARRIGAGCGRCSATGSVATSGLLYSLHWCSSAAVYAGARIIVTATSFIREASQATRLADRRGSRAGFLPTRRQCPPRSTGKNGLSFSGPRAHVRAQS